MRIACPPLVYGCPFINFTSSKSDMELITRRIIEKFEGDANTIEQLVEAIGLPKCRVCTHCFDGSSAYTLNEFADED